MARPELVIEFRPGASPLYDPVGYLDLPGASGDYISTPDHASLDIVGDIDTRVELELPAGLPAAAQIVASKWLTTGNQRSWLVYLTADEYLGFRWSPTGTSTTLSATSSKPVPLGDDGVVAVRATLDASSIGPGHFVAFYTAASLDAPWLQLGTPRYSLVGTTSIFASTAPLELGRGVEAGFSSLDGRVRRAELRNSAGTIVADPDFRSLTTGTTSFADGAGRTWTVQGSASIVGDEGVPWITLTDGGPHGCRVQGTTKWKIGGDRDDDDVPPGEATVVLANNDRLFDPDNTAGAYAGLLDPGVPFRIRTTEDGLVFEDQFYGFVRDGWEQDQRPPADSTCTVHLVDLLGWFAGETLPGVFDAAVLEFGPTGYWRLDTGGSDEIRDLGSGGNDGEVFGSPDFTDEVLYPGLTGAATFNTDEDTDRIDISRSPVLTDEFHTTLVTVFKTTAAAEALSIHPFFAQSDGNGPGFNDALTLYIDTSGRARIDYYVVGVGFSFQTDPVNDGRPHVVIGQSNVDGITEYGVAVDSATLSTTSATAFYNAGNGTAIGGTPNAAAEYDDNYFEGTIATVIAYDKVLTIEARQQIIDGLAGLAGQRSDQHIAWVLDRLGVPESLRNLDEGRAVMGAADTAGQDAISYLRKIRATEQGALYVDHHDGGKVRFVERYAPWLAARSTTVQATFSDDGAESFDDVVRPEADMLDVEPNGVSTLTNRWTITWRDGEETVEDVTSRKHYGPSGDSEDTEATTAAQARAIAQFKLALTKDPRTIIRGLGIRPGRAESAFPVAVDTRMGDRLAYRSRPLDVGSVIEKELMVEGVEQEVAGLDWSTKYFTSTAPSSHVQLFILGTSVLDGPDILAV